jgi:hypothetical protein
MASRNFLADGDYSRATPVSDRRFSYPFLGNQDRVSCVFEEDYWQSVDTYTPPDLSTPHSVALSDFYLVAQSNPQRFGDLYQFTRTFARIPVPQITYSTLSLNKPNPSALGVSNGTISDYTGGFTASAASLGSSYYYPNALSLFGNNSVYARKAATTSLTPASSGTFTVTYKTSTTAALAYNAADATINAAINGLASVIADGLTVSCTNTLSVAGTPCLQIQITAGSTTTKFTGDGSSLGPTAAQTLFSTYQGGGSYQQQLQIARRATVTAHGFSTSLPLLASTTATNVLLEYSTQWLVIDANTIAYRPLVDAAYLGQYLRAYTPGVDRVRTKITDTFYLPGISSGIATAASIPVPDTAANDALLLTLVASASTGYQTYDAQPLAIWSGQIYHQSTIAIDLADL